MNTWMTDKERLAIVTAKLEETLQYLKAMPQVPVTRDKCREIEQFLLEPWADRLRGQAERQEEGVVIGPSIAWSIKATLIDDTVRIKLKALEPSPMRRQYYQEILSGLVTGLMFKLTPLKKDQDRESVQIGRRL